MQHARDEKNDILGQWIQEYGQLVLRTAFYYVKDQMIAEDLAQDVFLRAYRHMDNYRADASVSTWLYRITVNVCKDYLSSWKHRMRLLKQWSNENASNEKSAEKEVMQKLNEDELLRKVLALPVKYREVIVLYYFEHLKSREIAEALGLKESTVRSLLRRGVSQLKDHMTGGIESWTN